MPKRQVFYSFHYANDCWRTQIVRNIGSIDGTKPVSANSWEEVRRQGDASIRRWINENMRYRSCVVVPVKENNGIWKGNEYLQLYPTIEYEDETTVDTGGAFIPKGYYVEYPDVNGKRDILPLKEWLLRKY